MNGKCERKKNQRPSGATLLYIDVTHTHRFGIVHSHTLCEQLPLHHAVCRNLYGFVV